MMSLLRTAGFIARHPLSRGRILQNFCRFLRWQIGSRLVPGPVAFDFVNDAKLFARPGMTGATGNIYVGLHDFEDMAFVLHLLRPGDLFVDAGANVGSYVVLASAGAGAHAVAFEPSMEAFQWLRLNIQLNSISKMVDARNEALGANAGTALLTTGMDTVNHMALPRGQDRPTVPVVVSTLDASLDGRPPLMLKIDVEGFETEVLRGAKLILEEPTLRCVLIELIGHGARYGFDERALKNIIEESGFEVYRYLPRERRLVRQPVAARSEATGNTLFIRDAAFVSDRLRTAQPFVVAGQSI